MLWFKDERLKRSTMLESSRTTNFIRRCFLLLLAADKLLESSTYIKPPSAGDWKFAITAHETSCMSKPDVHGGLQ